MTRTRPPEPLFPMPIEPDSDAQHGEIFTRRWVVEFILDLVGCRPNRDLAALRIVEPACGAGSFLAGLAARVSDACRQHGRDIAEALDAVRAFDLLARNVAAARTVVESTLTNEGWNPGDATRVAHAWVRQADYLLDPDCFDGADMVIGNPPYVRIEDASNPRMALYRQSYASMTGRADLYVGFIEAALRSLRPGGVLGFICADRWMRNQYGRELRRLIAEGFAVEAVISMHDVDAFDEQVAAYPAITVISKGSQGKVLAAQTNRMFTKREARDLTAWAGRTTASGITRKRPGYEATRLPHWFPGEDMWPAASPERLRMLEGLADRFVALGDKAAGVRVGIGVATGADRVFVTDDRTAVEDDRLLPLAMVRDTNSGVFTWSGRYLVNPWDEAGDLVRLDAFPRLASYLRAHESELRGRHVGRRSPTNWYRTIDKVDAKLTADPKLLFPDMKLTSRPVLEPGGHYPHHNLYFVTSDVWDLRVLGGILMSKVAEAFVDAYAVKMRGGTLRFQAQYLRRIRVPDPRDIPVRDRRALAGAFDRRDAEAATKVALRIYGIERIPL